jgi:hypothetical protein
VIGGLGSLVGAVLGSVVIVFLPPLVTSVGGSAGLSDVQAAELAPLTYGVVLVLVMILAPGGAASLLRRLAPRRGGTPGGDTAVRDDTTTRDRAGDRGPERDQATPADGTDEERGGTR